MPDNDYTVISCDQVRYSAGRVISAIRAQGVRAVLTYHGQPVAEIIPLTDAGMKAWVEHNAPDEPATPSTPPPILPLSQENLERWQSHQEEAHGSEPQPDAEPANES